MKRTKIVATLGPSSSSSEVIGKLIDVGMDVARINFSHGTHKEHLKLFETVKKEAKKRNKYVAVLGDLCGPKIRTGNLGEGVNIIEGETVVLTEDKHQTTSNEIVINFQGIINDLTIGEEVLFDDGKYKVIVESKSLNKARCKVIRGGIIKSHKGVNLPGTIVSAGAITKKDKEDAYFGLDIGFDYFALSFVQTSNDILELKKLIGKTPIIAKIERPQAVENLESIMDIADGFMVARGDLGVESGFENVPVIQKRIISEAIKRSKLVITATQMLESMISSPVPTRAEVSDVANAVLDGTSAVMLSAESAAGKYPIESVQFMSSIIKRVENNPLFEVKLNHIYNEQDVTGAIASAASKTAAILNAKAIMVFSESGRTAREISKFRHNRTIVALSPWLEVLQHLSLEWGIVSVYSPKNLSQTEKMIAYAEQIAKKMNLVKSGDLIVITLGFNQKGTGHTNTLKVHTVC